MGAILESPRMAVDLEGEIPPSSMVPDQEFVLFPTALTEAGDFFREDCLEGLGAVTTPQESTVDFPLPPKPGGDATPPEANSAISEHAWRPPQAQIPPSPGAALLEEFDVLYHTYGRRVYLQCFRMLGNREDAEDLTQEVFLQLFRKAGTFRGEASFSTWLHRLTVNTVLMQIRRQRHWHGVVISLDAAPGAEVGASDVSALVSTLPAPAVNPCDRISLEVAIAHLASGYKEIFLLHDVAGYQHDEIAMLLGINEGTSKSQLHKARLRLRALMGGTSS